MTGWYLDNCFVSNYDDTSKNVRGNEMSRSASITAIKAKIRKLQAQAEMLEQMEKPGIKQLKVVLKKYKLSLPDVKLAMNGSTKPRKKSKLAGKKVKPKYRNPANKSETWAGRGMKPKWVVAALKSGKKLEHLAI